jgi:hypothetical protein
MFIFMQVWMVFLFIQGRVVTVLLTAVGSADPQRQLPAGRRTLGGPPTPGQRHHQLRQSPPAMHFSYKNRSKQFIPSYLTGVLRRLQQQTGPIRPQAYVEKWISGISFSLQALYG